MTLILPGLGSAEALKPDQEKKRLEELYSMNALDASSDERFEAYAQLATRVLDAPMASIVLVDKDQLVFKAVHGRAVHDVTRNESFAAYAMLEQELLIVEDTLEDPRFARHKMVRNAPHVRSYAGGVIRGPSGQPLGVISVMDSAQRAFSPQQQAILLQLTRIVEQELQTCGTVAELRRKIREEVLLDAATQLPTETLFSARLARAMEKRPGGPIMVAVIRLERFEATHSAIGKAGAAYLVKNAAARLRSALQRDCLVGQTREDTIALAFALSDRTASEAEIDKLVECFRSPFLLGNHSLAQNVSIGTAMYPDDGEDSETLLKRARTALSAMPPSDTSRYRQYNRQLSTEAARKFQIETALKGAIERDELELVYQPKIRLKNKRLSGAEALLRWTTDTLGEVSPGEFIPVAEDSGLIVELGDWALGTVCRQINAWQSQGYECPEISVNVSAIQMRQPRFSERVKDALTRHALKGSDLNLEITEGSLIENIDDAINVMTELRRLDVSFSIDDFGKGFSSLTYLSRMPVQTLKIDRSFIERIPDQEAGMTLVLSIIAMGHALGLEVVAEGVETEEQLKVLGAAGCNHVQGFFFSHPLKAAAFAKEFLTN